MTEKGAFIGRHGVPKQSNDNIEIASLPSVARKDSKGRIKYFFGWTNYELNNDRHYSGRPNSRKFLNDHL